MEQLKLYHEINQELFFIATKQQLGLFCQKERYRIDPSLNLVYFRLI
jgi:hypothetical protein